MYDVRKQIIRFICLAQIASDAGKGIYELEMSSKMADTAAWRKYAIKDKMIFEAIKIINNSRRCGINYHIVSGKDQNGHDSYIIYFDVKVEGERRQVSFHSFNKKLWSPRVNTGRKTVWDEKSSRYNCKKFIEEYAL